MARHFNYSTTFGWAVFRRDGRLISLSDAKATEKERGRGGTPASQTIVLSAKCALGEPLGPAVIRGSHRQDDHRGAKTDDFAKQDQAVSVDLSQADKSQRHERGGGDD